MISLISLADRFAPAKRSFLSIAFPIAALALFSPGSALAQKNSGAASGPVVIPAGAVTATYVIDKPGAYVLAGNRTLSDVLKPVIEITASNVSLDLNGFTLAYSVETGGYTGVLVPAPANVEIRNGTIANPDLGIYAQTGQGLRIVEVRFVSNDLAGVLAQTTATFVSRCQVFGATGFGIYVSGGGALVTDCVVRATGAGVTIGNGSRVVRTTVQGGTRGFDLGAYSTASDCSVTGAAHSGFVLASGATLRDVDATNNAVGVKCSGPALPVIIGSRITNNTTTSFGSYTSGGGNVIQ